MSQFLGFALFLVIVGGLLLHSAIELPWYLQWIGQLPGDLIIRKKNLTIYAPLTSSILISAALSLILNAFFSKK